MNGSGIGVSSHCWANVVQSSVTAPRVHARRETPDTAATAGFAI